MSGPADVGFWGRWLSIVIIDLTLAGDNALVIALAVRTLPKRQALLGRLWGTAGAVVMRLACIAVVTFLFRVPRLRFAGGLPLIWIALRLVRQEAGGGRAARHGASLWEAVWLIVVADMAMSVDNVVAVAAAAHGDLLLVAFGISLSLPLVVWGSGILARLMNRYRWIIWLGGAMLGYVAGEMLLGEPALAHRLGSFRGPLHLLLPLALGATVAVCGLRAGGHERQRQAVAP